MKLYMKQKVFSWKDKFTIKDEYENDRYYVEGEFLSLGKRLHVYDTQHNEVALIRQKLLSFLQRYFVEIDGREVCQVVRELTLLRPRYTLEGLDWQVHGDFWAHEYSLYDGDREVMALSKHWFSWGDSYELDIADEKDTLLCLCVALAVDAALQSQEAAASAST